VSLSAACNSGSLSAGVVPAISTATAISSQTTQDAALLVHHRHEASVGVTTRSRSSNLPPSAAPGQTGSAAVTLQREKAGSALQDVRAVQTGEAQSQRATNESLSQTGAGRNRNPTLEIMRNAPQRGAARSYTNVAGEKIYVYFTVDKHRAGTHTKGANSEEYFFGSKRDADRARNEWRSPG